MIFLIIKIDFYNVDKSNYFDNNFIYDKSLQLHFLKF